MDNGFYKSYEILKKMLDYLEKKSIIRKEIVTVPILENDEKGTKEE